MHGFLKMVEQKMENWMIAAKKADFNQIAEKFHIDPVIARIIRNRDIVGDDAIREYLSGNPTNLYEPMLLKGMKEAVAILHKKIDSGSKIRVIGDYDIDGIMSSYILKRGLTELGGNTDLKIPNRITDGYGINENLIREASEDGIDTIVTCDNGISAGEQITLAKSLGLSVVVTDHHEVLHVPDADAVIDPKQEGDTYPYKNLCGASVAWKLILALGGDRDMQMLQFAAFATIGDIVDLTGENRIIVKEGLKQLHETNNLGLRALADICGTDIKTIDAYHIGFILGPCMNASGRLDTAMRACSLLFAADEEEAKRLAVELKDLNDSRKSMTEEGVVQAVKLLEDSDIKNDKVYVLYLPDIHESLAGIVAGRIREQYNHPCFVLTKGEDGVKGSGRSIEAYSMFENLVQVQHLLTKFGGHPLAAGLSMKEENVGLFRREINELCTLSDEDFVPKILIDVPVPISYISEELIREISLLEPFGKGNPKPVFAQKNVFCEHPRIFGANHNVLKLRLRSMSKPGDAEPDKIGFQPAVIGPSVDGVCFRNVDALYDRIAEQPDVSIIYYPTMNEYMGRRRLQIVITHFQ